MATVLALFCRIEYVDTSPFFSRYRALLVPFASVVVLSLDQISRRFVVIDDHRAVGQNPGIMKAV